MHGEETEAIHIMVPREQTHTSGTLEDRTDAKLLRALRAGCGGGRDRDTECLGPHNL